MNTSKTLAELLAIPQARGVLQAITEQAGSIGRTLNPVDAILHGLYFYVCEITAFSECFGKSPVLAALMIKNGKIVPLDEQFRAVVDNLKKQISAKTEVEECEKDLLN